MFFLRLKEILYKYIVELPINLYRLVRKKIFNFKNEIKELRAHIGNLRERNFELLLYHISYGNYVDASFRLWVIDKIISPNDPEQKYWKGILFFLNGKFDNAYKILNDINDEYRNEEFLKYIKDFSSYNEIPDDIYNFIFKITSNQYLKKYSGKNFDLFQESLNILNPFLPSLSREKEFNVLELGCNSIFSNELKKILPNSAKINSLEFFGSRYQFNLNLIDNIENLYGNIEFFNKFTDVEIKDKYDLILIFDTLSFKRNLSEYLSSIKNKLSDEAIVMIVLPVDDKTRLIPEKNSFVYSLEDILHQLLLADLKIKSINVKEHHKRQKYLILLVT